MNATKTGASAAEIVQDIDRLRGLLLRCRAMFPAITEELLGQQTVQTAPYYSVRGYSAEIRFGTPITTEFLENNRTLGKWLNENALIRLHGILKYHGYFPDDAPLDRSREGWREMDLLRLLRNALTKTPLNYRPEDGDNRKLREEIIRHFVLPENDIVEGEIPTPINHVVEPIFDRCKAYVIAASRFPDSAP